MSIGRTTRLLRSARAHATEAMATLERLSKVAEQETADAYEGLCYVQALTGGVILFETDCDGSERAHRIGRAWLRSNTFEGDAVRILTVDGEQLWDSREGS